MMTFPHPAVHRVQGIQLLPSVLEFLEVLTIRGCPSVQVFPEFRRYLAVHLHLSDLQTKTGNLTLLLQQHQIIL